LVLEVPILTRDSPVPPKTRAQRRAASDSGAVRILRATLQAVAEVGFEGLTADNLCIRAGATRAEFDQRWSDPIDAFVDALDERMTLPRLPDTGRLHDDLTAYAAAYLDRCSDPAFVASMLYATARARSDDDLDAKLLPRYLRRRQVNRDLIARAVARGELPPATDPDPILDGVLALGYSWLGVGHYPTPAEIEMAIRDLLAREVRAGRSLRH
jgi:AcrR family transcriptional regulator